MEKKIHEDKKPKKKVFFNGIPIFVEFSVGDTKEGTDENNQPWVKTMENEYGFIQGVKGFDKDSLDVYLGDDTNSNTIFVIHQLKKSGKIYDEDKVFLGFKKRKDAIKCWCYYVPQPKLMFGGISSFNFNDFIKLIKNKNNSYPVLSQVNVNRIYNDFRFENVFKKINT